MALDLLEQGVLVEYHKKAGNFARAQAILTEPEIELTSEEELVLLEKQDQLEAERAELYRIFQLGL